MGPTGATRRRSGRLLSMVAGLLVCGVVLHACGRAQPVVVRELVALAPAGTDVRVTHVDADMWGNDSAHWEWSFETTDPFAAIAAYRAWFVEHDIAMVAEGFDGQPLPATTLLSDVFAVRLSVSIPPAETEDGTDASGSSAQVPGNVVVGLLYDASIGDDGQLAR